MTTQSPSYKEWRQLYELAIQIKALAPWQWMTEDDMFGVQNPDTKEQGFVSVMGMVEEHFGISVYLGAEGLYRLWMFKQAVSFADPMELIQIPQLQASFEDRDQLDQTDRDLIKQLKLKFRGRNAWPMFRSYQPGLFPWFLNRAQARFLIYVLEQLLEVAPRFQDDPTLFVFDDDDRLLIRVPKKQKDAWVWADQAKRIAPPDLEPVDVMMDFELLAATKKLPKTSHPLEIDCFLLPTPVGEKGQRPFFPYMLLVVDAQAGLILGSEMLEPKPSVDAMWGLVPLMLVQQLASAGVMPREIHVRSPMLEALLQGLVDELGLQVKLSLTLPTLDGAREELEAFIRR